MSVEGTAFKWLSKNWDKITNYKNKWTVFFKHGRVRVMVFGAGGVGKTTFKDYVIEGKKALLEPVKHEESFEEECFDLVKTIGVS